MDATLKIVRDTRAQEGIIEALARSPVPDEDIEELRSIRLDGRLRDAFDLYEKEKIREILDGLFPEGLSSSEVVATVGFASSAKPLDQDTKDLLTENGFGDVGAVQGASDEELLAINGIGPKRLREIRERLG